MARDKNEAINSYIGDMLALEDHIEKALKGQLTDLKDYPDVVTELRQIHRQVDGSATTTRRRTRAQYLRKVISQGTQVAIQIAGTLVPGGSFLGETTLDNPAQRRWHRLRERLRVRFDDRGHCLRRRLALKGPVATREFVKHYAERKLIGARIER